MSWQDRIHPEAVLISPEGNLYRAKWKGDTITAEKRVAMFDYPNVDGTVVQDLGLKGFDWPMTLYFDDDQIAGFADPDSTAIKFLESLKEKGSDGRAIWNVTHPVYGVHELQPLKFELVADPTDSGGVMVVNTTWIEPIAQRSVLSVAARQNGIVAHVLDLNSISTAQAALNVIQNLQDQVFALRSAYQQALAPIKSVLGVANAAVNTITSTIDALLVAPVIDLVSLTGQIQTLMQSPEIVAEDLNQAIGALQSMVVNVLSTLPVATPADPANSIVSRNKVAAIESVALAILGGAAQSAANATLTTRLQAVSAIQGLATMLDTVTNSLDVSQAYYDGIRLDGQYFSQSKSYANATTLTAETQAYLTELSFSLKSVKTYALQSGRASMEIAMAEYGIPGVPWNDAAYQLFIDSNNLIGQDVLWLPAGRQVVIYVG